MANCRHGWELPAGVLCPDCLWEEANRITTVPKSVPIVDAAVVAAASCMPTVEGEERIFNISETENNWKAIKVARTEHKQPVTSL